MPGPDAISAHVNRLARRNPLYLLQHQHNPVDWFAWGEEAFERARRENKPIFLSIGYSTCHWCHVMERESFENRATADFLNAHFVSIKVDREERPDVDKIYMTAVQAMSGQGGWPLNCFLTPELKPFYGGTYFPPENSRGRASFLQVLRQIAGLWETRRGHILGTAAEFHQKLQDYAAREPGGLELSPALSAAPPRNSSASMIRNSAASAARRSFPGPASPPFSCSTACAPGTPRRCNGASHLRTHGGGRHARPARRRFRPLRRGCAMARAALREDAL